MEEWRIYAVEIMVRRAARDEQGDLSIEYQTPGIVFARSNEYLAQVGRSTSRPILRMENASTPLQVRT